MNDNLKTLGRVLFSLSVIAIPMAISERCESGRNPNEIGMHANYKIICEYGRLYKVRNHATVPVLNPDGSQCKCQSEK
jgi:hypothetical protein